MPPLMKSAVHTGADHSPSNGETVGYIKVYNSIYYLGDIADYFRISKSNNVS